MKKLGKILKAIGIVILIPVVIFVAYVLVVWVTEFRPDDVEALSVDGQAGQNLELGQDITIASWNIGYGALGQEEDYFMDGGENVNAKSKEEVVTNMEAIKSEISEINPDILLLQETDVDSHRSFNVDERAEVASVLTDYDSTYACNYKVLFIAYPWPMMGGVDCGISTFSKFDISSAERQALPCPFGWPYRLCNLKRCLSVQRIPVSDSDKELVVVNLHLEAYDSGEGKIAQTAQLRELLEKEAAKGNYVIAGGDFNQSFSNVDLSAYPINEGMWEPGIIAVDEFSDNLTFIMDEKEPSCRSLDKPYKDADKSSFQYYVIDGFIVSSNVKVNEVGIKNLDFVNSDHNPLIMNVTLEK